MLFFFFSPVSSWSDDRIKLFIFIDGEKYNGKCAIINSQVLLQVCILGNYNSIANVVKSWWHTRYKPHLICWQILFCMYTKSQALRNNLLSLQIHQLPPSLGPMAQSLVTTDQGQQWSIYKALCGPAFPRACLILALKCLQIHLLPLSYSFCSIRARLLTVS